MFIFHVQPDGEAVDAPHVVLSPIPMNRLSLSSCMFAAVFPSSPSSVMTVYQWDGKWGNFDKPVACVTGAQQSRLQSLRSLDSLTAIAVPVHSHLSPSP